MGVSAARDVRPGTNLPGVSLRRFFSVFTLMAIGIASLAPIGFASVGSEGLVTVRHGEHGLLSAS